MYIIGSAVFFLQVLIFITRLLDRGANPSHYDSNDKKTPLHLVATKGWTRVAYKLVEYGAYLGAKDSKNRTALEIAILEEHDDISQFLIKSMKPIRLATKLQCLIQLAEQ